MSETMEQTLEESEPTTEETPPVTRKPRRRFKPDEITLAHQFIKLATPGTPIAFEALIPELRKAVLPANRTKLIDRGLLEIEYNLENGAILFVTVNEEMLKEYEHDLVPVAKTRTLTGEPRQRRPKGLLADPKYRIKLMSETNPERPDTHAFHNWNECYKDGLSVLSYLGFMEYNRHIIIRGRNYFNGPAMMFLEKDWKAKHIRIYDATLNPDDPGYWVSFEDLTKIVEDDPDSAEAETEVISEETA